MFALAVGLAAATSAQTAQTEQAATASARLAASPTDEGEIVVTANKREQNLNDVGLSVTAIGSQALADRRITSVQDVAAAVPGLKFAESGAGTPIYTLRGIGFNEESLGVYPSVSVYTDEVPLPFPVLTLRAAFDLERVEVLKGPQGTLFGQNATGGAINYIAAKPTDTLQYGADLSYGRFNAVNGNAFIGAPLGDKAGVRLAVSAADGDGWQRSLTRPDDRNGAQKYISGRLTFTLNPTDALALRATVTAWQDKSEPQAAQLIAVRGQNPASVQAGLLASPFGTTDPRSADWTTTANYVVFKDPTKGDFRIVPKTTASLDPRSNRKFIQGALRADLELGDVATLTSNTSYLDFDQHLFSDKDGSAQAVANIGDGLGNIRSFNQELRIANTGNGPFRWVVGGNYENSKTFEDQALTFANGSSSAPGTLFINTTSSEVQQDIRNYAFFANGEYDLNSKLTLKLGGRYTNSRNSAELCSKGNGDGLVSDLFNIIGGLSGNPFTPIGVNGCYVLNSKGVPGDRIKNTLAEDNISWRAGLDYKLNSDTLFFANVSRGYKAGSFPTLASADFKAYFPVIQESVTSYEAGFKASLADNMIQLNGAAFYYDYNDKQIRGKVVDPIFDVLDVLINVPKSRVLGAEAELIVRPAQGLSVGTSVVYLNSKVRAKDGVPFVGPTAYGNSCTTAGGRPGPCDFTGSELPFTPNWSYTLDADYRSDLGSGVLILGANLRGQSSSVATLNGRSIQFRNLVNDRHAADISQPFVIPAYATVDARIGYEFGDRRYKVMVWGKNVLNKYYVTNAAHYLDATVRFVGQPVTYGITFSIKN
ncbi:TonB-dependent receptor [Polymorphobacter glacialis]|uniref:TonB-dependent receptor n=1 Tax=Sandarakinorhabdus glacialis TaxID=1614636 RepID=A0A917A1G5_9SPHN|nr:TonB-dependent receptor [Polymorphobacter glacialis]